MKILLSIIVAVFFTACDASMKSYNDLAEEATKDNKYSPDCIAYAMPKDGSTSVTGTGLTMFITRLEACKTREMMNNFTN